MPELKPEQVRDLIPESRPLSFEEAGRDDFGILLALPWNPRSELKGDLICLRYTSCTLAVAPAPCRSPRDFGRGHPGDCGEEATAFRDAGCWGLYSITRTSEPSGSFRVRRIAQRSGMTLPLPEQRPVSPAPRSLTEGWIAVSIAKIRLHLANVCRRNKPLLRAAEGPSSYARGCVEPIFSAPCTRVWSPSWASVSAALRGGF